MDTRVLRGWLFDRQGLMNPDPSRSAADVLARTGWARSVGGANPYLALHARAGTRLAETERALEALESHELPSARGCTYIVPRSDYALALKIGQGFSDEAPINTAKKFLGVTEEELQHLQERVQEVLRDRPLDPRELKDALGDAVRNLGAEGKKRGTTTTLPLALGRLQTSGRIRRVPVEARFDQQRYRYALWSPSPLDGFGLSQPEAFTELARRYFQWIGVASVAHFQWFSGLGVKASKEAVAPLGLVPLEAGSDLLMFPEDLEALRSYQVPDEPRYALVGSIDALTHLRRDTQAHVSEEDRELRVLAEKGMTAASGLQDLPSHGIFDRGRLIGFWEYDPFQQEIVWQSFVPRTDELKAAVSRTEAFIREDLGDARSFSLDSPESRKPRLEALRALA